MADLFGARLARWEVEVIEKLAEEALDKASTREYIQHPERFVEKFIVDAQGRMLENARERKQLVTHAERLLPLQHPPGVKELHTEPHDVADPMVASRWIRLIPLVFNLDEKHEWRVLHGELVTRMVAYERETGIAWKDTHDGLGILDLLEDEAKRLELIPDEPARLIDSAEAVRMISLAMARSAA